ncbi:MAG: L,D-transpeptidase family protein [Thermodesulfovibrionales bacterium]|nr:L,D-transpeptidase family protein [Thermodesulfovibrionales bacterium]
MKKSLFLLLISIILISLFNNKLYAEVYTFNKDSTVIGFLREYTIESSESLIEVARKFNLGYNEIVSANPDIDPFIPPEGKSVIIPTFWILPEASSYEGILINLSEMRLYYFFQQKERKLVKTFPIGIGREGYDTPTGKFKIIQKIVNPSWHVPESIRAERPHLPKVVPPGPDNPLGTHALRLSIPSYLIHGTNKPWGVGRKVSFGCIRLYPEDIPFLFHLVKIGHKVEIVKQPVKVGMKDKKIFIEVHEDESNDHFSEAFTLLRKKGFLHLVDTQKLKDALETKSGIPIDITN